MENEASLKYLRDGTQWFIDQDPTTIVLTPRPVSGIGPGGGAIAVPGVARPAQTVKLIAQGGDGVSHGEGGQDRDYSFVIVFRHDASVAVGDTFSVGGGVFVVESFFPDNGYEIKATARQHGIRPTEG